MPFYSHLSSDISQDSSFSSTSSSTCPATTFTSAIPSDLYGKLLSSTNIPTAYVSPNWARNTSAPKYQLIEIKNASIPIPDSSETNVFDPQGFDVLDGEFLGPVEGSSKSGNAGREGVEDENDGSPNSAEFSNEVPNRNKNLGSSADGAIEDIAGDVEHVTAEESSRYLRQHSTTTADKQATIEEATQTLPPGTVHGITGMYTPSVKQILDEIDNYTRNHLHHARKQWLKDLIRKYKDWIGLDANTGNKKALDYAAGTGFLSWALAPYFGEIVGIDRSPHMVAKYNALVTRARNLKCKMRAIEHDVIGKSPIHKGHRPEAPEIFKKNDFDFIAMTQGIDSFYGPFKHRFSQAERLMRNLDTLLSGLVENGTFLIIELEKVASGAIGMKAVLVALELLHMEDIKVIKDLPFTPDRVKDPLKKERVCYMIKARKGKEFEARQKRKGALRWEDFKQRGGFD